MNNKKLLFAATALAVSSTGVSHAAIDDAGMKYVSASEGLSGSIRIRLLANDPEEARTKEGRPDLKFDASRLVYRGETDLGGGMLATYFMEFRVETGDSALEARYLDAGIKGRFGHVRFGRIETASEAILPSADLSNDAGFSGQRILSEEYDRGLRWISPDISGFLVGLSADTDIEGNRGSDVILSSVGNPKTFDQYEVAVAYDFPVGIGLGASYSVIPPTNAEDDNREGLRVGIDYGRDIWGVGYNFHNYRGDEGIGSFTTIGNENVLLTEIAHDSDTRYREHVVGVNLLVGKFSLAANHSIATLENKQTDVDSADGLQYLDVKSTSSVFDVGYRLGSKAKMIAAYKTRKIESEHGFGTTVVSSEFEPEREEYYLLYRIDF